MSLNPVTVHLSVLCAVALVSAAHAGVACDGDTNGDSNVDIDDIQNVVLDFGTDGSANGGDADGDGDVDIDDVQMVVLNFGVPCL